MTPPGVAGQAGHGHGIGFRRLDVYERETPGRRLDCVPVPARAA